jgi:DNA-directed RNA polymerase subunit RPC12/RpoP
MEQQQMNLNVSLDKTSAISCNKCGSQVFQEGVMLRKASRLLTGTAQDALIPIQVFACMQCGSVNEEFLPSILRQQAQTQQPEIVDVVEETTEDKGAKIIKF